MIPQEDSITNLHVEVIMITLLSVFTLTANNTNGNQTLDPLINILIWTNFHTPPLVHMVEVYMKKCIFRNCIVTTKKIMNEGVKTFDIILFDIIELRDIHMPLPKHRSVQQRYIFVSREPPALYDIPPYVYDGVFNLTWTYKLDSDVTFRYFIIKNKKGAVIGPKRKMQWMDTNDMKQISKKIKRKLQYKRKAGAWIVSNCRVPSARMHYVHGLLIPELAKYNLKIDIFGFCGDQAVCPNDSEQCHAIIESEYYFYLAFENSICEDYVTEKVLTATKHFTVPIVFGGADYTRFLPPGSYLDARALGPQNLASIMNDTISNKSQYYDFFKWHRYYSLHDPNESPETDDVCKFCSFLNEHRNMYTSSVYDNFNAFWSNYIEQK